MISYDNRAVLAIFLRRSGSVVWRSKTVLPAIASTVVCALVLYYPGVREHMLIPGSIARIYATILGFVIAFRARMAFQRFFEGVNCCQTMLSQWRDAFCSLSCFIEASIAEHQRLGHVQVVNDLVTSKARLLHWFTLLIALAVQKLRGEEGEIGCDLIIERLEPTNRFRRTAQDIVLHEARLRKAESTQTLGEKNSKALSKGGSSNSLGGARSRTMRGSTSLRNTASMQLRPAFDDGCEDLREQAVLEYGSAIQIIGKTTEQESSQLDEAHDVLLCITKWILLEISALSITGRLLIAPPILSRVYQELSNAMLAFFKAMQIPLCPFPFPFAQFLQYALLWWICLCPFAVLIAFDVNAPDLSSTWMSLPLNYLACFGFVVLNEIAVELEEPFGEDDNDYPVHQQQWNVIWAIEDCYFTDVPGDFTLDMLGEHAIDYAQQLHALAGEKRIEAAAKAKAEKEANPPPPPRAEVAAAALSASGPAPPARPASPEPPASSEKDMMERTSSRDHSLASKFEELRDTIDASVQVMQSSMNAKQNDLASVRERLGAMHLGLKVPMPLPCHSAPKVSRRSARLQSERAVSWEQALDPHLGKPKTAEFAELRELARTHMQITEQLQALVAEHRGSHIQTGNRNQTVYVSEESSSFAVGACATPGGTSTNSHATVPL